MDIEDRIRELVADVLLVAPDAITMSSAKNTTERWDSLAQINLVTALEEAFDIGFGVAEIESLTSVAAIVAAVSRKLQ